MYKQVSLDAAHLTTSDAYLQRFEEGMPDATPNEMSKTHLSACMRQAQKLAVPIMKSPVDMPDVGMPEASLQFGNCLAPSVKQTNMNHQKTWQPK